LKESVDRHLQKNVLNLFMLLIIEKFIFLFPLTEKMSIFLYLLLPTYDVFDWLPNFAMGNIWGHPNVTGHA
jgi:hypothetical protein